MSLDLPNRQDGNLKHSPNTSVLDTSPPPLTDFKSYNGCIFSENTYLSVRLSFNLEDYSIFYSNEKQPVCACFTRKPGLINSFIKVPTFGITCIKCALEELWNTNSQNSQPTQFLRYFKYLSPIKLIIKYCIWVFCMQLSVAMETVNPKNWCSSCFQKVNIQLECFIF